MKCAEKYHTYQLKEHVKERHAKNMRNTRHSTKTAQHAGPVDVSAKIVSHQMKHAKIYHTYQSRDHVKERCANNQRNTRHSTKAAQQAADVEPKETKDTTTQSTCENMGQNYCTEEEWKLMVIAVTSCRKNFSSDPRYALEFEVVSNTEIQANTLAKVKPKNRYTPVMEYSLCQECVCFLKKTDNYAVTTVSEG